MLINNLIEFKTKKTFIYIYFDRTNAATVENIKLTLSAC